MTVRSRFKTANEVREQELRRVARDLHDAAGGVFASVHLVLSDLERRVNPDVGEELERARAMLVRAEEQLRRLAHEIRPDVLDDLGLRAALVQLSRSVSLRTGMRVELLGDWGRRLPSAVELALYRAIQEALNNVVRHAGASRVVVSLALTDDSLRCRIEDDGCGFDASAYAARSPGCGMGLSGIRERMAAVGGSLDVGSACGRGTRLELRIPLEGGDAASNPDRR